MKYNKWIGFAACAILIAACFLPWTFHADLNKSFTGFFSEKGAYGKPGKIFIFFAVVSMILIGSGRLWAKRTHIFIGGLLVAYAIKTYTLFTSCYNAYCPEKQYGIYLVMVSSAVIFLVSLFPNINVNSKQQLTTEKGTY